MAYNNNNQGIGDLDLSQFGLIQPESTNMKVAGGYDTPTAGAYGFNLIELDRLKNAGYNPGEVSNWENKEDVQSLIRSLEPQASAVNEYGYPLTASLSGAVPNRVSAIDQMANYNWSGFDDNIAKNMALANKMNTALDNTLQPVNTYDRGFQTGLDEKAAAEELQANQLNEDYGQFFRNRPVNERNFMSPIKEGIGSFKTNVGQKMGEGWNFAQQLPGMAMSALSGIPGIGALMGMLPKSSPEQKAMMDLYNSAEYQDVLGQIPGMENYNPVYGMGAGYGLSGAIGKRLAMRNSQKTQDRISKLSKERQDKFKAQTLALEKLAALEASKDFARTGASGRRPGSGGPATHKDTGASGGYSPGQAGAGTGGYSYDSGGRQGYGYGLKYGGRVRFANGGLASLFTRRG